MNNRSFYELHKDNNLKEIYSFWEEFDKKILIFDNPSEGKVFDIKKVTFIYAEQVLFSAYYVYGETFKIDDVLALYTSMPETFISNMDENKYNFAVKSIYYLKNFSKNERELLTNIKFYLNQKNNIITKFKMFFLNEDNQTINFKNPDFYDERIGVYINLIENSFSKHLNSEKKPGDKFDDNRIGHEITNKLKEKRSYNESIVKNINNILDTIDDSFIENMGEKYKYQNDKIKVYDVLEDSIIYSENKFRLNEFYTHLAGKTGAGKTVYTDIIINKLAKENKRMLIITDNTINSKQYKERLDKLGIKSTILTGKKRNHYIERYYKSKRQNVLLENKEEGALKSIILNESIINNLDYFCSEAKEPEESDYDQIDVKRDCSKCKDGFLKCGYYNMYREMIDSNVIIATAKTLLLSKMPRIFDLEERTLFEICILYSDLMIIDEVDEIQKEFDGAFIDEIKIYSGNAVDDTYSRGDIESLLKIVNNIDRLDISTKSVVNEFKKDVRILDNIVDILIVLFLNKGNQDFIRESIGVNKSFNLISLIELFFEKYIRKMQVNQMENRKVNNKSVINDYYNFFVNEDKIKYITSKYFKLLEEYDVDKVNLENEEGYESIEEVCHKIYNGLMKDLKELNNKYNIRFKILRDSKKSLKTEKEEMRTKFLIFIMLISLIDSYYKNVRRRLRSVVPYVKESKDNGLRDLVFRYLYKEDIPLVPESFLESFISGYTLTEEKETNKNILVLKKNNYTGIGREVLFNTTKNLAALYDTKQIPMFMASATSIDTKSSLYTIKYKVNRLLENDNQKRISDASLTRKELKKLKRKNKTPIILKCHIFKDEKGLCFISGSSNDKEKENIQRITTQLNNKLLPDLIKDLYNYYDENKIKKGILITASSARIAKVIFDNININGVTKKMLWIPAFNEEPNKDIYIEKSNVERISDLGIDILIAVNKSISRGYNIMASNTNEAYFRHIIIANRYLPSPSDNLTIISYLHDYLTRQFMKDKKKTSTDFKVLKKTLGKLQVKLKFQDTYNSKDDDIKNMIAGNMFADLCQLKGRAQRGGAQCIIHIIDSKFYWETAILSQEKEDIGLSKVIDKIDFYKDGEVKCADDTDCIFNKFKNILDKNDPLVVRLFDDMIEAFENHQLIVH